MKLQTVYYPKTISAECEMLSTFPLYIYRRLTTQRTPGTKELIDRSKEFREKLTISQKRLQKLNLLYI